MAISQRIISATIDAIATMGKAEHKFVTLGGLVSGEYHSVDKFDAVKAEYITQAILPAMGKDAERIMSTELLRKGTPAYLEKCAADPTYKEQHAAMSQAKINTRATADANFRRVRKYAFPPNDERGPSEKRDLKTRTNEELAALIKAHQKAEDGNPEVIKALELALKANNK